QGARPRSPRDFASPCRRGYRVKRREFITLVGGAAAWPLAARAQQPARPVVGFLYFGWPDTKILATFHKGLNETGYFEGRDLAIEFRSAQNDTPRVRELAADLVRRQVAAIAAPSGTAALAAMAATTTIPIVFNTAGDPVQMSLVASLNRPGGNIYGGYSKAVGHPARTVTKSSALCGARQSEQSECQIRDHRGAGGRFGHWAGNRHPHRWHRSRDRSG